MGNEQKPSAKAFFINIKAPMPLGRKIKLLLQNNFHKIKAGKNCCGHSGEPGC
jgi:hypothetical protein